MGRSEVGISVLFYLNWFSSPMSDTQLDSLLATASSPFFVLKWAKPDFPDSMKILVGDLLSLMFVYSARGFLTGRVELCLL